MHLQNGMSISWICVVPGASSVQGSHAISAAKSLFTGTGILLAAPIVTFGAMLALKIPLSLEGRSASIPGVLAGCVWQVVVELLD